MGRTIDRVGLIPVPDGTRELRYTARDAALQIWKYNTAAGYWKPVRSVTPETKDEWLRIWRHDDPDGDYIVSAGMPRKPGKPGKVTACDSVTPALLALAALVYTFLHRGPSEGERNAEADWDLTKYKPKPREW